MDLKPARGRDWLMLGLGAAGAALALGLALPRYDIMPTRYGVTFLKVDRWTGQVSQCSAACRAVPDSSAPPQ